MNISVTLDIGMGLEKMSDFLSQIREPLENFFDIKKYGNGMIRIGIVINCRPSYLNFKLRKRFDKATKTLYYDVMLNYEAVVEMSESEMKKTIHEALNNSIELVMGYGEKINDFEFNEFKKDWKKFFWEFEWNKS